MRTTPANRGGGSGYFFPSSERKEKNDHGKGEMEKTEVEITLSVTSKWLKKREVPKKKEKGSEDIPDGKTATAFFTKRNLFSWPIEKEKQLRRGREWSLLWEVSPLRGLGRVGLDPSRKESSSRKPLPVFPLFVKKKASIKQ